MGLATWLAVSAHAILALPAKPERLTSDEYWPFGLSLIGFGLIFWLATHPRSDALPIRVKLGLCALEAIFALSANQIFNGNSLLSGMLLVAAVHVGILLPLRLAFAWIGFQTLGLALILYINWPLIEAASYTTGWLCFQVFAVLSAQVAVREVQARQQLMLVVAELQTTRSRLAEASRDAERLRIARELHDLVGHHLTALTMNLQVAEHGAQDERSRTHVERARTIAVQLLSRVRASVRAMRDDGPVDWKAELEQLQQHWEEVKLHAALPDDLDTVTPAQSHILLRCIQEIVTNARKHGQAQNVWIRLDCQAHQVQLSAHDDGHGALTVTPGCGLLGMRERLESVGGQLKIDLDSAPGFALTATLPLSGLSQ
ncbi:sensor histidine kinase [Deinococcus arboris]|uniref:sensor histidine kinase n=1 Tax=Deinococcus arboris TaxID=2682977 RepID=UPI0018DD5C6E